MYMYNLWNTLSLKYRFLQPFTYMHFFHDLRHYKVDWLFMVYNGAELKMSEYMPQLITKKEVEKISKEEEGGSE